MVIRPVDGSGDMLPVLSSSDLFRGARAVALLAEDRLKLCTGDWWENPAWGNEILELLQEGARTEADLQALAVCLSSYTLETPGVSEITDERSITEGRQFRYTCTVETEDGDRFQMDYEL